MALEHELLEGIKRMCKEQWRGNVSSMARDLRMPQATLNQFLNGARKPGYETLTRMLDAIGVKIVWPSQGEQATRPVQIHTGDIPEDVARSYRAIPVVTERDALNKNAPSSPEAWAIVWKTSPAILQRTNLVCVRVTQDSMAPLLHVGDYVIIDRADCVVTEQGQGNIFLVNDPQDGPTIKRVRIQSTPANTLLFCYCDNVRIPPSFLQIPQDDDNYLSHGVLGGRVVMFISSALQK